MSLVDKGRTCFLGFCPCLYYNAVLEQRTKPDWGFVLLIGKARYLLLFYWNIYVGFDICILLTIVLSGLFDFSIVYEGRISILNRILCCFGTFFSIIHIVFPLFLKLYFRIDLYRYHHCL